MPGLLDRVLGEHRTTTDHERHADHGPVMGAHELGERFRLASGSTIQKTRLQVARRRETCHATEMIVAYEVFQNAC